MSQDPQPILLAKEALLRLTFYLYKNIFVAYCYLQYLYYRVYDEITLWLQLCGRISKDDINEFHLTKIPKHVGIVCDLDNLADTDTLIADLSEVILKFKSVRLDKGDKCNNGCDTGKDKATEYIKYITVYDANGVLMESEKEIRQSLINCEKQKQDTHQLRENENFVSQHNHNEKGSTAAAAGFKKHDTRSFLVYNADVLVPGHNNNGKSGSSDNESDLLDTIYRQKDSDEVLQVILLGPQHGKQDIVRVINSICKERKGLDQSTGNIRQKQHDDGFGDVSKFPQVQEMYNLIDERVIGHGVFPDPDVLITFSPVLKLHGYPLWRVRLSEIWHFYSLRRFTRKQFKDMLRGYSKCQQRAGT